MRWQDRFSIAGKTALVTGASSGIGAEIVRVFTEAGATVIATGQSEARLAKLAAETGCKTIAADISTVDGCAAMAEAAKAMGTVEILVNSAGVALVGPATEFSAHDWDRTMAINLRAPFTRSEAGEAR